MKRLWIYGTSTPIQRIGVIVLGVGLLSLFSWMIKEDLSFEDLFNSYYLPGKRDSMFFHLFFYFIPLGLLMSWGYQVLIKLKEWILSGELKEASLKKEVSLKKQRSVYTPPQKILHFKNNPAAFEFASQNYKAALLANQMSVGIVRDIFKSDNEKPLFLVELANNEEKILAGGFNDIYADKISVGNLVYWGFAEEVHYEIYPEMRAIGHIIATLHPEFDPNNGKWSIKNNLTK